MGEIRTKNRQPNKTASVTAEVDRGEHYSIIAHSHLKWDWVWQRPQQFLSRLSKKHPVLFVEGPVPLEEVDSPRATLREVDEFPNVIVLQIQMPAARWTDGEWIDEQRRRLVQSVLAGPLSRRFEKVVQWFYDPMAVSAFAGRMDEVAIVYDCMDQLSQFRFAPPELIRRERELLTLADVVFAGGPAIWEEKRNYNSNCFCYGCGVDASHFGRAAQSRLRVPEAVANLPHPIYGYIGVIDERLDYELIMDLAKANGTGSVVMVGPWTKIDPDKLPRRKNLHWLGARDYSDLPSYAKVFDVCLMPFALNEATEFINPTKALEYMATGRPIVSTPVRDVVRQFSDVVAIGSSRRAFIRECARSAITPDKKAIGRGRQAARSNTWDAIVQKLELHVDEAICRSSSMSVSAA